METFSYHQRVNFVAHPSVLFVLFVRVFKDFASVVAGSNEAKMTVTQADVRIKEFHDCEIPEMHQLLI